METSKTMYRLLKIITFFTLCMLYSYVVAENQQIMHDPTKPADDRGLATKTVYNSTDITAIFIGNNSQTAIINSAPFKVGDKIAEATIIAIDTTGVTLKEDDNIFKIPMNYPEVKNLVTKQKEKP